MIEDTIFIEMQSVYWKEKDHTFWNVKTSIYEIESKIW